VRDDDQGALRGPARPTIQSRRVDVCRPTSTQREPHRGGRLCRRSGVPRRRARPDPPLRLVADRTRRPARGRPRTGAPVRPRDRAQ